MGGTERSGDIGFSLFDLVLWAAVIVTVILLVRYLAKPGAGAPAVAIVKTAAVPFSPWFPLR